MVAVAFALAACAGVSIAATGVPLWENTFRQGIAGYASPAAARELADGSRLMVAWDSRGLRAVRYDSAGGVLSTATIYPAFATTVTSSYGAYETRAITAVDPFGGVYVGAVSNPCCSGKGAYTVGSVWVMKFDGLTGRAAWPAAATWSTPTGRLATPDQLLTDAAGNLIVSILSLQSNSFTIDQSTWKLDGESGSTLWGPVALPAAGEASVALDGAGNVFVCAGNATGEGGDREAIRYAASTGAVAWGPVTFDSGFTHVAGVASVDGSGDLVFAGPYIGFGSEVGFQAIKFDGATGAVRWGPARWESPPQNHGAPSALAISASGNVLVAGVLVENGAAAAQVLEFSGATGLLEWSAQAPSYSLGDPVLLAAGNGDGILAFEASDGQSVSTMRLRGLDGGTVWGPAAFPGFLNGPPAPVCFLTAGGTVFLAALAPSGQTFAGQSGELEAATGNPVWGPTPLAGVAAASAQLNDVTVGPDGNPIVTGWVTMPSGFVDWATLKYDAATGAVLWGPSLLDAEVFGYQSPWEVQTDAAGDAFVTGYTSTKGGPLLETTVKYSGTTGQVIWTASGSYGDFFPYGLAIDGSGNAFVVGQMTGPTSLDTALFKLSGATGQVLWGPILFDTGVDDYPFSLALDAAGDAFLIGGSYDPKLGTEHWFTWKASGTDGHAIWGPVLDTGQYGAADRAAVSSAGDVFVTGQSDSVMKTAKYSGATGAVLWGPMVVTGPEGYAGGLWVVADGNGDAIVTGTSFSLTDGVYDADFVTIKYRGSDGATLWGPAYFDAAANGDDYVYSVVLDASGNPIVSGQSETAQRGLSRIATLKYDGATGNVLWGPVFTGPVGHTFLDGLAARGNRVFLGAASGEAYVTTTLTESLGIATMPEDLGPESCGTASGVTFTADNGSPPYSWSVVSGSLPAGLALGAGGALSGAAVQEGSFPFSVQVQDSIGATALRAFVLDVRPGANVPVVATPGASCAVTLSVEGSWSSYQWLPNGETTPSITVAPLETTTYAVLLSDGSGCVLRGAIEIRGTALANPACLAPGIASITPESGTASGGTPVVVTGTKFQPGAALTMGGVAAGSVTVGSASSITATAPALAPGTVNDVVVSNPDSGQAVLAAAWTTDFLDVPPSDPFHAYILSVLRNGVSAGCGNGNYCPQAAVTRAQMAVFLVRAKFGGTYEPPPASGTVFGDVPADGFAAAFIEQLAALGVTSGCGGGNYCPDAIVTRAQMAVFLLKTSLGEGYVPPPPTGTIFADVHVGDFAAAFIEDLYGRGITGGCGGVPLLYCPAASSTRGQMAVFLVKTFDLP